MFTAHQRDHDILHPFFLGPLFLYGHHPWLARPYLDRFFPAPEQVNLVLFLYLLGVTALTLGTLHSGHRPRRAVRGGRGPTSTNGDQRRLQQIALVLALVALGCYAYGIVSVGGFVAAFSVPRAADTRWLHRRSDESGTGSRRDGGSVTTRRGLTGQSYWLMLLGLLPNFLQGRSEADAGARSDHHSRERSVADSATEEPRLWMLATALIVAGLSVAFVWSQRKHLYLGSTNAEVRWDDFAGF
jgi:hypothetical protein